VKRPRAPRRPPSQHPTAGPAPPTPGEIAGPSAGWLSIGALSRAVDIPIETLRTWERRYGFPVPDRKPSGHRVYPVTIVPRLRRMAEARRRGHRAGEVVGAADGTVDRLIESTTPPGPPAEADTSPFQSASGFDPAELIDAVRDFDADRLTRMLLGDWTRLGVLAFLDSRIAPALRQVGEEWADGRLSVAHEHFLSARVGDLLRALRLPFEERAAGPLVLLATLPGEHHTLGLEMAALVLAAAGCRLLVLGAETPRDELARLAGVRGVAAVAISASRATAGPATRSALAALRRKLPVGVTLVVGGEGAPAPTAGAVIMSTLASLDAWARRAVHHHRAASR